MKTTAFRSLYVGLALCAAMSAGSALAQNIDKAISAFKGGDYEVAAAQFYAVLRFESEEQGDVAEAQYGLAKSFEKLGLPLAALKYYEDIAKVGNDHPNFQKAVEGLVDAGDALDDDLKTPQVLDSIYTSENASALQKMNPEVIQRVHFVLGRFGFNRGNFGEAKDFLGTVKAGNPTYPHAQYMLALLALGVGNNRATPKYDAAIGHFERAREAIPLDTADVALQELRDLATLGIARAYYEEAYKLDDEDPKRTEGLAHAQVEFRRIPRFSGNWDEALFERAWTDTVKGDYGRALGALHSLSAPYFVDEFYPEARILQAIIYYYNCQWDRVNALLADTKTTFEPMVKQMEDVLGSNLADDEWYPLLQKSLEQADGAPPVSGLLPKAVASSIFKDPRFRKMERFLQEIAREAKVFESTDAFAKSDMGREMSEFANDTRDAYLAVIGKLLKAKVRDVAGELSDVTTRASIVSLETKTAEAEWLEQGKTITGGSRKRLPRPFIPDDTFQFWWFRDEYWVDELGYYEFTIKTECFE